MRYYPLLVDEQYPHIISLLTKQFIKHTSST
jgi:hypothetical protein